MIKRIEDLEQANNRITEEINQLNEKINMVDSYSKHFMAESLTLISIVIAIAGLVLVGAAYFMVISMINKKMDNEIEKRILKKLGEHPPVYYAKGEGYPNNNLGIILESDIEGIKDLEPNTLLILEAKPNKTTYQQMAEGFKSKLIINEKGERVLVFDNYAHQEKVEENALISWSIVWMRKY